MISYHQMSFQERITTGKAWLDAHAPAGYVFNMFEYQESGPIFVVNTTHNEYTVLYRAFLHNREWVRTPNGGLDYNFWRLRAYLGLGQDDVYMLGLDLPHEEMDERHAFDALWEPVLRAELWRSCARAGRMLAAGDPASSPRPEWEKFIFGRGLRFLSGRNAA